MATQPTLGGTTLPYPAEYRERVTYRGGSNVMADGTIIHDLVSTSNKRTFSLRWSHLDSTDYSTVLTAYGTVKSSSGTYVSPEGNSYTVERPPNGEVTVEFIRIPSGERYNVELELREE